jgi:amino acid adenylation domain-containing protein
LSDVSSRVAALSPEKRAALEKLIRQKGLTLPFRPIVAREQSQGSSPLSFGQERLWFLHRLDPASAVYNVHTSVNISDFEADVVRRAVAEILRRHHILRTTFREEDGRVTQVVMPTAGMHIPLVDLGDWLAEEREEQLARLSDEMAHEPFDLVRGPLVRAKIVLAEHVRLLLVTMHHIVTDRWSIDVFDQELQTLCNAFAAGKPSPLASLPIQYGDFAAWQRDQLQGPALDEQLAYWRCALEGAPPVLELPTDRPRPVAQTDQGAFQAVMLGRSPSDRLRELARREGATLFMVLLTAFKILLHRYTGQHDIIVGLPVGGRTRAELEPLIGFFVNTLVLRTDLSGDPAFTELLSRVRKTTTDALAHQDLPFEKLVATLAPDRHLSRAPLFQVMVQLLDSEAAAEEHGDGPTEPGEVERGTSLFDLSVDFTDSGHGIRSLAQYSTDLFDDSTITRLLQNWRVLLEAIADNPERRISEFSVMTAAERIQVIETCNDTGVELPVAENAHALFEQQVERTPDALALIAGSDRLSYRRLNDCANQLAVKLRRVGVGPEVIVGLCMNPSAALVVSMLGVLKSGGAYVPIDVFTPPRRIQFILEDTKTPVLLTESGLLDRLPADGCHTICLDRCDLSQEANTDLPVLAATAENLAYVIYTSGSSGRPKGVMITHGGLMNFALGATSVYGFCARDRVLQFASIAFDASVEEIYPALLAGGTVVMRTPDTLESVERLLTECGNLGVTVLDLPTAFWHLIVQELAAGTVRLPASVRLVIVGSERALPERLLQWDEAVGSGVRLMHGYGPTEVTVASTVADLTTPHGVRPVSREVSIGRPLPNVRLYVLDGYAQPAAIGVAGEAWIGGRQLARGYLNQPELTAQHFVDDPFCDGERAYRTGDRLSRLPDGQLLFHGRIDEQIKIRGYRVEPGEVESLLVQHADVQACAVIVVATRSVGLQLVAYVTVRASGVANVSTLRAFLEERLPPFMMPSHIVILDRLPLTLTGKVDRQALAAMGAYEPRAGRAHRAPRSDIERQVAAVWSFTLGTGEVGLDDGFFELGGHSLLALQIVGRLRMEYGIDVPLRTLFEHPRLEDFARAVTEAAAAAPGSPAPLLAALPRERFSASLDDKGALVVPEALLLLLNDYANGVSSPRAIRSLCHHAPEPVDSDSSSTRWPR